MQCANPVVIEAARASSDVHFGLSCANKLAANIGAPGRVIATVRCSSPVATEQWVPRGCKHAR